MDAPGYSMSLGAGLVNGNMEFGGTVRTDFHGYQLIAGDDVIRFNLPSDVFDTSQYFFGRGLGASRTVRNFRATVFAGATANFLGASYFQAARAHVPFGLLFIEMKLSPKLRYSAQMIGSSKQTAINGLEWSPSNNFHAGFSAGMGANSPYAAAGFKLDRSWFDVRAAYISAGKSFRRISTDSLLISELARENVQAHFRLPRGFGLSLAHENLLSPRLNGSPGLSAALNQVGGAGSIARFDFNTTFYHSRTQGEGNLGFSASVRRNIGSRINAGMDYYRSKPESQRATDSLTGRFQERLSRHISVIEYVSRSNGQTSINAGGEFTSRHVTVSFTHETTYVPFRPASVGGPFVHLYNVMIRVGGFKGVELSAHTNVDPEGKLRYTTSVGEHFYRYRGLAAGQLPQEARIGAYVVKGAVLDLEGLPVAGAAIQVNGKFAFTDFEGRFLVRFTSHRRQTFAVNLENFLTAVPYQVVWAPSAVEPQPEDAAKDIVIRLQRVPELLKPDQ